MRIFIILLLRLSVLFGARLQVLPWQDEGFLGFIDVIGSESRIQCAISCTLEARCDIIAYSALEVTQTGPSTGALATTSNCQLLGCEPGFQYYNDACYIIQTKPKQWSDAEDHCQGLIYGPHLMSIHSHDEHRFLSGMVSGFYNHARNDDYERLHAGMSCTRTGVPPKESCQWTDGSEATFFSWALHGGKKPEFARVTLNVRLPPGIWYQDGDNLARPFICKYQL